MVNCRSLFHLVSSNDKDTSEKRRQLLEHRKIQRMTLEMKVEVLVEGDK